MVAPAGRLARVRRGERLTAAAWNDLIAAVLGPRGAAAEQGARRAPQLALAEIDSIDGDYLVCRLVGAAIGGVVALRPPLLRNPIGGWTRGGITYTYGGAQARTADNGAATEPQEITPSYLAGDLLVIGGPVFGGLLPAASEPPTTPTVWMDLNVDGRQWAATA